MTGVCIHSPHTITKSIVGSLMIKLKLDMVESTARILELKECWNFHQTKIHVSSKLLPILLPVTTCFNSHGLLESAHNLLTVNSKLSSTVNKSDPSYLLTFLPILKPLTYPFPPQVHRHNSNSVHLEVLITVMVP